ncbi:hypothetical protein CQA66_07740 [Helicobacter aurati]|uniref:Uncharacterized protein n=1 Tax=Helicobacter aurati TaxID=137778 RepID=A0A3D8IZM1_9HELI|nr:hypothetical protein [Helicobacter aurati]RDU70722.1 hypothetical protein CQA66_07740 [Helicobacter aurati]
MIRFMTCLWILFLVNCSLLLSDSFLNEKNQSYQKSKTNRGLLLFVTSNVIPIDKSFLKDTPYGRVIDIPQSAFNMNQSTNIMSRGMYNHGNYTIFRSNNHAITFYRYSRNNSNLYARIAPNIYNVTHITGTFYKIEPMPENLSLCSLVISRSFEAQQTSSPEILLDLNEIPNYGTANILLECPKPNEEMRIEGYGDY